MLEGGWKAEASNETVARLSELSQRREKADAV